MRVLFTNITKYYSVRQILVGRGALSSQGYLSRCRTFSQEFTHDYEDDHSETQEILTKLRRKHHYHEQQKKINDVMVIEPDYKRGRHRCHKVTANHRLEEACGLVEAISNWRIQSRSIEPVRKIERKTFFGKGKVEELAKKINQAKADGSLDAVYIDFSRLSTVQYRELEKLWDVKVLDRFGIVLQIFKERATTGEAKIQVELAEIPYLKSRLVADKTVKYDQQRGGTHSIGGAGETQLDIERRILSERETKLKKKLEALKKRRNHVRHERHKRHVPIVSVVGYTNAGKTTLIKALTGDIKMQPENKLFATLDVTGHTGKLPSGLHTLFIDTVGFVSDLPPELVDSFHATLEDVVNSDLIVHVQDASHPDREIQREEVMSILKKQLKLKGSLLDTIVDVKNKADLCSKDDLDAFCGPSDVQASALHGTGLDVLLSKVQQGIMQNTGRMVRKVVIPPGGPQLSWLYHEATVFDTVADQDGLITAKVILDTATNNKFEKKFGNTLDAL